MTAAEQALEMARRVMPSPLFMPALAGDEVEMDTVPQPDVMIKYDLDLARYPTAVCNDGSAGAYYLTEAHAQNGRSAASNVWLVFLQGGGWCWDQVSCAARYLNEPSLMSSQGYPPTRTATGIFSPDPSLSPFANANKVYLPYCSSDAFVGNRGMPQTTTSNSSDQAPAFHFRGQDLIKATLHELQTREHNPLAKGHVIYFGGCSAGARGALFNFEFVPAMVPKGVRVFGVFDSPLW